MGQLKILKASAGSGKTFMLAYEYVRNVVREPLCYKNILAVTFTNKATEEMKNRILDELHTLTQKEKKGYLDKLITEEGLDETTIRANAKTALNFILHDYTNFSVMTIDGFFQKIVRSFIKELHLECDYTIDFNTNYLLKLAIDILIRKADDDPTLRKWIDSLIDDNISNSKSYNIQESMLSLSRMVLSEEFDKSYFEKNRDSLITFFNALSAKEKEMKEHVQSIAKRFMENCGELGCDDFPGKSRGLYPYVVKIAGGGDIVTYSETVSKALTSSWTSKKSRILESEANTLQNILIELCHEIDKNSVLMNSIKAVLPSHRTFVLLADISRELYEVCSMNNKMLLSDTNYLINRLIKNNDTPYLYEKMGNRYDIIMIDEFQDTSKGQWENFVPLLDNALSQSPEEKEVVTLVGDIKQSIYRWRGGDWRILSNGIKEELNDTPIEIELVTNYRSKKEIIDFNNKIIRECATEINNTLNTAVVSMRESQAISTEFAYNHLNMIEKAYDKMEQQSPKAEGQGGYVEIIKYDDDLELAQTVEIIKNLQDRGYNANDIAILVRSKAHAQNVVSYIIDYKKSNPELSSNYCFDILSAEGLSLNRSSVVKFIISIYKLSLKESISTRALYNRYLGYALNSQLTDEEAQFMLTLPYAPVIESFERIVDRYSLGDKSNNMAYLQAMHNAMIKFSASETGSVSSFLEWWETESDKLTVNLPEGQNAIKIDTVHKSKGLQYKVVIMPYCQWSLTPSSNGNNIWATSQNKELELPNSNGQKMIVPYSNALANSYFSESYLCEYILTTIENFNIFYVALTRAVQELYLLIPSKTKKDNISSYVEMVIPNIELIEDSTHEQLKIYKYGAQLNQTIETKEKEDSKYIEHFKHRDYHNHLALHLESDKYFNDTAENEQVNINARGKGILLHKLFENIESLDDLDARIDAMHASGTLSTNDATQLKIIAIKALQDPLIRSWFENEWEVRNENSIILPNLNGDSNQFLTMRPDRVLTNDGCAIVIDYKFGAIRNSHKKQINRYKELLLSMGYLDVKGYLWYITEEQTMEV